MNWLSANLLKNKSHLGSLLLFFEFQDESIGMRFHSSSFITNDHGIKWSKSYFDVSICSSLNTSTIGAISNTASHSFLAFVSLRIFSSAGASLYTNPGTSGLFICNHLTFSNWIQPRILTVWSRIIWIQPSLKIIILLSPFSSLNVYGKRISDWLSLL